MSQWIIKQQKISKQSLYVSNTKTLRFEQKSSKTKDKHISQPYHAASLKKNCSKVDQWINEFNSVEGLFKTIQNIECISAIAI
jgi:hypothetical protein